MLAFNSRDVRPTPVQKNGNAEAMRAVPQYEPRTVVQNRPSYWERLSTEIGAPAYANARACHIPSGASPEFFQPQRIAVFGGDYGVLEYAGAPVADTMHRQVVPSGSPALVRGTMHSFIDPHGGLSVHKGMRGLGDVSDEDFYDAFSGVPAPSGDFYSGAFSSPVIPDTTGTGLLSPGFFAGASAQPLAPTSSVYYSDPAAPTFANPTFAAPSVSTPVLRAPTTSNAAATQQAAAITSLASVGNTAIRAATTPGTTAMTAQQAAALQAAQNPLNQVVPGLNMSVGSLLLMGGVLIGGAVLISKLK